MKNIKTFEKFWTSKNKEINQEGVEEFEDRYFLIEPPEEDRPLSKPYDISEKKRISAFVGNIKYLVNTSFYSFIYEYKKSIGFGLHKESNFVYKIDCEKYEQSGENFYVLNYKEIFIDTNKGDRYPRIQKERFFKCSTLEIAFKKMKKMKKETI